MTNKTLFYLITLIAIGTTVIVGIQKELSILYILFTSLSYAILLYLIKIAKHKTSILTVQSTVLFIVLAGLYFLLDTTYMEQNLEHKFSFLFMPIWQLTMLLVSGLVIYLSNGKQS